MALSRSPPTGTRPPDSKKVARLLHECLLRQGLLRLCLLDCRPRTERSLGPLRTVVSLRGSAVMIKEVRDYVERFARRSRAENNVISGVASGSLSLSTMLAPFSTASSTNVDGVVKHV
jgi:hypothetical protein